MQTAEAKQTPWRFDHYFMPLVIFLGLAASLIEAARSPDPRMVAQGWIFGTCMAIIGVWYMWMYAGREPLDEKRPYAEAVVKAGVGASMFWGIAGMLVGVIIALQLSFPNLF
jgi:cytochrome c oxidase cbb3-type subunit 1